jgi:hypothetical protein
MFHKLINCVHSQSYVLVSSDFFFCFSLRCQIRTVSSVYLYRGKNDHWRSINLEFYYVVCGVPQRYVEETKVSFNLSP